MVSGDLIGSGEAAGPSLFDRPIDLSEEQASEQICAQGSIDDFTVNLLGADREAQELPLRRPVRSIRRDRVSNREQLATHLFPMRTGPATSNRIPAIRTYRVRRVPFGITAARRQAPMQKSYCGLRQANRASHRNHDEHHEQGVKKNGISSRKIGLPKSRSRDPPLEPGCRSSHRTAHPKCAGHRNGCPRGWPPRNKGNWVGWSTARSRSAFIARDPSN